MNTEERVLRLENAFATLGELTSNMDERMDDSSARQSVFENNLAALSQIVVELSQAQRRADERAARSDERLDRIAALFERHISEPGGKP